LSREKAKAALWENAIRKRIGSVDTKKDQISGLYT